MKIAPEKIAKQMESARQKKVEELLDRLSDPLTEIYEKLPMYWAVWKNRFGDYSIGHVGDESNQAHAEYTGSLSDILDFVRKRFKEID